MVLVPGTLEVLSHVCYVSSRKVCQLVIYTTCKTVFHPHSFNIPYNNTILKLLC